MTSHRLQTAWPRPYHHYTQAQESTMTRYVISFDDGAMDAISAADLPAVGRAAHAVVAQAKVAGVWITGGGVLGHAASVVAPDGSITRRPAQQAAVSTSGASWSSMSRPHDAALAWAARFASSCRCPQEVWPLMDDPEV